MPAWQTAWVKGHVVLLQLLHRAASASAVELAAITALLTSTWTSTTSSPTSALGLCISLAVPLAQGVAAVRAMMAPEAAEGEPSKLDEAVVVQALTAVRPALQGTRKATERAIAPMLLEGPTPSEAHRSEAYVTVLISP